MTPTNTPRVFHVETTWKRSFPRLFNVKYTWCVCRKESISELEGVAFYNIIHSQRTHKNVSVKNADDGEKNGTGIILSSSICALFVTVELKLSQPYHNFTTMLTLQTTEKTQKKLNPDL